MEPRLLTIQGAAAYLACSVWSVRDLAWRGELQFVKLGRRFMFDRQDLDSTIDRLKQREGTGQVRGKRRAS